MAATTAPQMSTVAPTTPNGVLNLERKISSDIVETPTCPVRSRGSQRPGDVLTPMRWEPTCP